MSALVAALDNLVLERLADGRFVRRGVCPSWCHALRAETVKEETPFIIEEIFPFLEAFLPEALNAWREEKPACTSSDFWTEVGAHGEEIHLEATAIRVCPTDVLVIRRNDHRFAQHQLMLQRARELRLTHDALMREIEQKDVLVHAIVHDLAAPLHSILGTLSLLSEMPLADTVAPWIQLSLRAATRQRQLIGEILDVFVAESGALATPPATGAPPDVCEILERVAAELEPVARRRNVRIEVGLQVSPCTVVGEETRLFRVLTNLVDNALRHSPPAGVVRVDVYRENASVRVTVEDQGPGVPDELRPQLFEKFARGDGRAAGTGLGLYFCRITVARWGGGIGYEARQQGGSRFWVRLPLAGQAGAAVQGSGGGG